jgi:hypothetical protein
LAAEKDLWRTDDVSHQRREITGEGRFSGRWLILVALIGLMMASLGCSLGRRLEERLAPGDGPRQTAVAMRQALATYTPWPTFTPTAPPYASPTPTATWLPWPTPTPTDVPIPTPSATAVATATFTPVPSATPWPTGPPVPTRPSPTSTLSIAAVAAPSTATPTPAPTPTPSHAYLVNEVFADGTTNHFLSVYIAVVNAQEIPIGGVKAVGLFEPGGQRYESPLSKWFFEGYSAPGDVIKSSSVKFEPPGGIQAGTWFIHLEDEWGARLSEDVAISIDSDNPEWFFVKFRQPGPPAAAVASAPTPTTSSSMALTTPSDGSVTSTGDWSFVGVNGIYDPDWESVFVYGEVINNTGSPQRLSHITGDFYDDQGQVVVGQGDVDDFYQIDVVPPGGVVPFELALYDVQSVADFDLVVIAEPSGEAPRQDFEFSDLDAYDDAGDYCVGGRLRNPGGVLEDYLMIVVVLYNGQDNVIYFDSYEYYAPGILSQQEQYFEVCVDRYGQEVARYDVRAWGK